MTLITGPTPAESVSPHSFTSALASRFGLARAELLALDPANDPFDSGTPGDVRLAGWFGDVYEHLGRPRAHLRDLHYQVVVRGLRRHDGRVYEGTRNDWTMFQKASRKARDLGLVSPWAFEDRRTQAQYRYDEARDQPVAAPWFDDGAALLERPRLQIPDWQIVAPSSLRGVPTPLSLQPVTVELWIEKDSAALNSEVLPVAREFGCRVVVGAGFQSKTAAADLVDRSIKDGRERVVLWLADADAKGESMAIATARHTEFLCRWWLAEHEPETVVPRIVMDRVALTLDQLAEVEAVIGRAIPVSPDVDRDEGRVELQALAAFAPGWVEGELRRRLEDVTDNGLADKLGDWEAEAEEQIEVAWEDAIEASEEALNALLEKRDAILERFDLEALHAALDEIEPERLALETEIAVIAKRFDPTLPELPHGVVDIDEDGRDWLLDTDREYVEQLNAYRRQEPIHRRRGELELVEPTCEWCGDEIPPGRRRFCTEAHRKQSERAHADVTGTRAGRPL